MNVKFNIDDILTQFNRLDIKVRYAIFAGCILAVIAMDYVVLIRLQIGALSGVDVQVKKMVEDTGRVKTDIQRINQIKKNLDAERSRMEAFSNKVRLMQEVPVILDEISKVANEFNVQIDQLTPSKESQELLAKAADAKYYALPIVIGARSGYHMFGRFLNKLESGNLLFMVKELRMENNPKEVGSLLIQTKLNMILIDHTPDVKEPEVKKK